MICYHKKSRAGIFIFLLLCKERGKYDMKVEHPTLGGRRVFFLSFLILGGC